MVWFDFILLAIASIIFLFSIGLSLWMAKDFDFGGCFGAVIFGAILIFIVSIPVLVFDTHSGYTVGEITSVDKNFFGSTAVYIKTTNNKEEKYCVETKEKAEEAASLVGKKVKISYGKRIGIYSVSKCDQAPIDKFEVISEI